jgi:Cu/Ag efflux protein CusF
MPILFPKRLAPLLAIGLFAAGAAHAQFGGGQSGGGGGHGHGGRRAPSTGTTPTPANPSAPTPVTKPENQIEITGVVRSIAAETDRVTIAYEAVEALNWPAGTMPFVVAKPALLQGVTVGEKVRFRLDSQQIADLRPF